MTKMIHNQGCHNSSLLVNELAYCLYAILILLVDLQKMNG